jgi:hypothetical protein
MPDYIIIDTIDMGMEDSVMGGKTSSAAKNRYNAKSYDMVRVPVPRGSKAIWQARADQAGVSLAQYVRDAVAAYDQAQKAGQQPGQGTATPPAAPDLGAGNDTWKPKDS